MNEPEIQRKVPTDWSMDFLSNEELYSLFRREIEVEDSSIMMVAEEEKKGRDEDFVSGKGNK